MRVLSLFDGMSCGMIALRELGIEPEVYYASEVDKYAIKQTQLNFPNVVHVGDVRELDASKFGRIDLLIGGSPCTSFSSAGKMNGMSTKYNEEVVTLDRYLELKGQNYEFEGESYLFWEYMRILTEVRKYNPNVKFLLENVVMSKKWEAVLTNAIGVEPVMINSNLLSAQNRKRLYWTNIAHITQPEDEGIFIRDILEDDVDEKYYISDKALEGMINREKAKGFGARIVSPDGKANTVLQRCYKDGQDNLIIVSRGMPRQALELVPGGKSKRLTAAEKDIIVCSGHALRRLTPLECARLQTVPGWYEWIVSDTQIYRLLGNGWTVEIIKHIFSFIKLEKNKIKELELVIKGRGETKGFTLTQVDKSEFAYIYESRDADGGNIVYEVFRRVENKMFACVSYPNSSGFGDSVYMGKVFRNKDSAITWFEHLNELGLLKKQKKDLENGE